MFSPFYLRQFNCLSITVSDKEYNNFSSVNDITILKRNDEIVGYNIYNASEHFHVTSHGIMHNEKEVLQQVNKLFLQNDLAPIVANIQKKFVVGYVQDKQKHQDSDKLSICTVNVGDEVLQIVCGAQNVDKGQKVPVALIGATMQSGLLIKKGKLRGVESNGMICSKRELGLSQDENEKGIWVMDQDLEIGKEIFK